MAISELPPIKEDQVTEWVKLWGRQGKALQAASEDPVLSGLWHLLRCVMASKATQILELPEHPLVQMVKEAVTSKGKRLQEWGDESVLVREIADLLRARVQEIRHAYKEDDLPAWIRCATYHQLSATTPDAESKRAFIEEGAKAITLKIERLLPDDPFPLDDATLIKFTPDQIRRFGFRLSNLSRALRPPQPKGRPRKVASDEPARAGNRSLDPSLSARAYQMSLDTDQCTK